jgi:uncharacterized membrane protein YphA (DoxX/SURF4 family)
MESKTLRIIRIALRVILGAMFIYSAYRKLEAPWQLFAGAIMDYKVLPDWASIWLARTLPWAELALGALLISGYWLRTSSTIGALIIGGFLAMMTRAFILHMEIECGCFGPTGDPISWRTLARDGSILAGFLALTAMSFLAKRKAAASGSPA